MEKLKLDGIVMIGLKNQRAATIALVPSGVDIRKLLAMAAAEDMQKI